MNGVTTGPQSFSRPLGKKCKKNVHSKPRIAFMSIENPLKHDVEKEDLSIDQRLLYKYTEEIGSEKVDEKYSAWKTGQLHSPRCLNLAILLSIHEKNLQLNGNFIKLDHYVIKVYSPSWFEIKSSSKLHESPRILFQNLSRIDQLSFQDVKTIEKQNLQGNSFCSLPENFL